MAKAGSPEKVLINGTIYHKRENQIFEYDIYASNDDSGLYAFSSDGNKMKQIDEIELMAGHKLVEANTGNEIDYAKVPKEYSIDRDYVNNQFDSSSAPVANPSGAGTEYNVDESNIVTGKEHHVAPRQESGTTQSSLNYNGSYDSEVSSEYNYGNSEVSVDNTPQYTYNPSEKLTELNFDAQQEKTRTEQESADRQRKENEKYAEEQRKNEERTAAEQKRNEERFNEEQKKYAKENQVALGQDNELNEYTRELKGLRAQEREDQILAGAGAGRFLDNIPSTDIANQHMQGIVDDIPIINDETLKKENAPDDEKAYQYKYCKCDYSSAQEQETFYKNDGRGNLSSEHFKTAGKVTIKDQINKNRQQTQGPQNPPQTQVQRSYLNNGEETIKTNDGFKAARAGVIREKIAVTSLRTTRSLTFMLADATLKSTGPEMTKVYRGFRNATNITMDVARITKGVALSRIKELGTRNARNALIRKYGVSSFEELNKTLSSKLRSYGINQSFDRKYRDIQAFRIARKIRMRNPKGSAAAKEARELLWDYRIASFSKKMTAKQRLRMNFKSVKKLVTDVGYVVGKPVRDTDVGKGYAQSKRIVTFAQKSVVTTIRIGKNLIKMPVMAMRKVMIRRIRNKINVMAKEIRKLKKLAKTPANLRRIGKLQRGVRRKNAKMMRLMGDRRFSLNPIKRRRAKRKALKKFLKRRRKQKRREKRRKKLEQKAAAGNRWAKFRLNVRKVVDTVGKVMHVIWITIGIVIAIVVLIIILIAVFENVQINKYSGALDINSTEQNIRGDSDTIDSDLEDSASNEDRQDSSLQDQANSNENYDTETAEETGRDFESY